MYHICGLDFVHSGPAQGKKDQQTHVKCSVHYPMVDENKKFGPADINSNFSKDF